MMIINKKMLLVFVLLYLFQISNAQVLEIANSIPSESLKPYLKIYADTAGNINVHDIMNAGTNIDFVAFDKKQINSGIKTHWLELKIANSSQSTQFKFFGFGDAVENISLYITSKDSLVGTFYSGANIPVDSKEIKTGRDNIIKVAIPAHSNYTLYAKLDNETAFGKQFLGYLSEYFAVYSPQYFDANFTKGRIFNSFYYGAIFIMFFYNLFLAFSLRSREYAAYVAFTVAFFIFNLFSDGYPSETIFAHLPNRDRLLRIFVAPTTFIAYIVFSRIYLKTKTITPRADKLYFVLVVLLASCYIPIAMGHWWIGRNLMTYILIAFIAYYAVVSVVCYKRGYKPALFYIVGNAMLLVSGLIYGLYLLAFIPHNGYTRIVEYLPQVGSIFELAFFSLGLAQRIKIAENAKSMAQLQTIEAMTENKHILLMQNEILETKVTQRTEDLFVANRELNGANTELKKTVQQIETERKRIDQLLLNILPKEIVLELKQKGTAVPRHYEMVSVLFADLVNFTSYAAKLPPAEITKKLDTLFYEFDKICANNSLEKIKTIGDCYMAAGGLPLSNATNALDAVKTALAMIEVIKDSEWQLRIGIHTGAVVAGVIGINKFAYDIWGDVVNIASRLESTSENNRINISKETYLLVKDEISCEYRGKLAAKNKGEIDMYFVQATDTV